MIKVLNPGFYTSIQDLGRFGYRNQGVPISGCMDSNSANLANSLLNNLKSDAVLEITISGPKLQFMNKTTIVITGADITPKLNNNLIQNNKPAKVLNGDVLSFGKLTNGVRSYIAVKGGIQSELILNSRSQFKAITNCGKLKKGDFLSFHDNTNALTDNIGVVKRSKQFYEKTELVVSPGPEFHLFSKEEIEKLMAQLFTVSKNNNRMGYQMEENVLPHTISLLTSPVLPGTVQLMPSGKIVVLMQDAQTTGGYPRVLQLTKLSISVLAQKINKDRVRFKLI